MNFGIISEKKCFWNWIWWSSFFCPPVHIRLCHKLCKTGKY